MDQTGAGDQTIVVSGERCAPRILQRYSQLISLQWCWKDCIRKVHIAILCLGR